MAELAVLIPTYLRAEKLAPLAEQIAANTATPHRIYFIAEYHDEATKRELLGVDAVCVFGDFGSCARAMNAGFWSSSEPYVFTGNDDLEFPEGWELPALEMCKAGTPIVGVNEGHGRMTCFAMAERAFIEKHSGVFDRPRTLYHPYLSQYVDTEFADYAKARAVWGEAHSGGVIHRHHDFGDADPSHPNYRKARETLEQDIATYNERKPQWEAAARG